MGNYSHSGYLAGKANKKEMNISSSFDLALGNTALNLIALPTYYFTRRHKQVTKTAFSILFDEVENWTVVSHPLFFSCFLVLFLIFFFLWFICSTEKILSRHWFDFQSFWWEILTVDILLPLGFMVLFCLIISGILPIKLWVSSKEWNDRRPPLEQSWTGFEFCCLGNKLVLVIEYIHKIMVETSLIIMGSVLVKMHVLGTSLQETWQRVFADIEANFSTSVLKSPSQVSHHTAPAASCAHRVRKARYHSAPW